MRKASAARINDLKADVLDSVSPPKSQSTESVKIRKYFPETWIWNETNVGYG